MQNLLKHIKKLFLKFKLFIWKIMNKTLVFEGIDIVKGLKANELVSATIYYDKHGNKIIQIKDINGELHEIPAYDKNIALIASFIAIFESTNNQGKIEISEIPESLKFKENRLKQ
jgi:hypothetical protein